MLYVLYTYYNRANDLSIEVSLENNLILQCTSKGMPFCRTAVWQRPFTMFRGTGAAFVSAKPFWSSWCKRNILWRWVTGIPNGSQSMILIHFHFGCGALHFISQIRVGNVYPMTLAMFQSLLNASYSYFTMLRGVTNKWAERPKTRHSKLQDASLPCLLTLHISNFCFSLGQQSE